jgi:hypothetical protein
VLPSFEELVNGFLQHTLIQLVFHPCAGIFVRIFPTIIFSHGLPRVDRKVKPFQERGECRERHRRMHQKSYLSPQAFVKKTRWDLPVWAGRHKFTDDALAFAPFVLGDSSFGFPRWSQPKLRRPGRMGVACVPHYGSPGTGFGRSSDGRLAKHFPDHIQKLSGR